MVLVRPNWICSVLLILISVWSSVNSAAFPDGIITNNGYQRNGQVQYIQHGFPHTWMDASDICQKDNSDLLCFSGKTEVVSLLRGLLERWKGTEIWLGKIDCESFAAQRCASLSIKNFGEGRLEEWNFSFNCSKSLPFICSKATQIPDTEPPPIIPEQQDSSVVCPPKTRRNINWPRSTGGTVVRIECPDGQLGYAYWTCSVEQRDWHPENPNLSDCKSAQMSQLFAAMPKIDLIKTTKELHSTIQSLQYGGDVTVAIDILDRVDDVYRSQAPTMTQTEKLRIINESSLDIVHTCNKLVESKEAWEDIPKKIRTETGSKFLSAVDETGSLLVANSALPDKLLQTENVVIQTHRHAGSSTPPTIQFPVDGSWQKKVARITIPVNSNPNDNTSGVVFAWYSDLRSVLPSDQVAMDIDQSGNTNRVINTAVISANITDQNTAFNGEVQITLEHFEEGGSNPQCVYWDNQALKWNTEGCKLSPQSNSTHTVCICNHLTNFAVLMDIHCANCQLSATEKMGLDIVTMTGCLVSLFCLSVCIVIFTIFRTLYSIQNTIHRNLCICLWIAQALLLGGLDRTENGTVCGVIAGFMQYFFLAAFFWMFLEAFHILLLVIHVFTPKKLRIIQYYLAGYGAPALIVGITAAIRHKDYGTPYSCWMSTENGTIWSFIGPVIVIVAFNTVALCVALWTMFRITASKDKTKVEGLRMWVRGAAVLLPLLGITWAVGFLYLEFHNIYLAYAFAILNSLQGFGIFIGHVLFNKKVKKVINRSIERSSMSRSGTNRNTKSSSFQGFKFSRKKAGDTSGSDTTGGDSSTTQPITNESKPTTSDDVLTDDDFKLQTENPRLAFSPSTTDTIPEEPEDEVKYVDDEVEPTETDPLNQPELDETTPLKNLPEPLNPRVIFTPPTGSSPVAKETSKSDDDIKEDPSKNSETPIRQAPPPPASEPPKTKLETEIT